MKSGGQDSVQKQWQMHERLETEQRKETVHEFEWRKSRVFQETKSKNAREKYKVRQKEREKK